MNPHKKNIGRFNHSVQQLMLITQAKTANCINPHEQRMCGNVHMLYLIAKQESDTSMRFSGWAINVSKARG